jgi:hypothetical protein
VTPGNNKHFVPLVMLLLLAFVSPRAFAAEQEPGIWAIFSSTDTLRSDDDGTMRWRYWFDAQARFFDLGNGDNQYLLRPGVGYDLNDNFTVWAGYARFRSRNSAGDYADEDRFWQQLTWTAARRAHGMLSMRVRLEERSLSTGDDLGLVLRYMARYTKPLGESGRRDFVASLEPFVSLRETDWGGRSGLRQNRLSLGVAWKLSGMMSLETSYMNAYSWADSGEDRMHHIAVINLKTKF